ncbi:MAG: hypothetical protein MJ147_10465 [Clostridia bacterium]|nr:hypothetical protein [Clostridia bacterium]
MKKILSVILALVLLLTGTMTVAFAKTGTKYTVINPYQNVDWGNSETYKACLHCHTIASDGKCDINEWLGLYYADGYDIIALTDHGVINNGWKEKRRTNGIFNGFKTPTPLTEEQYNYYTNGTDRNGRGMIDITGGIECNMAVVSKTHVNGYFTTYGQGVWGKENDYETAPREIEKAGGYSVLNHVGDWVNSNNFPERSHKNFYIGYFADILTKYKTCLGLEIINNTDNCTRGDRELWDELLPIVIPQGRNIWGFADDDSEYPDEVGRSFELFPMSENTEENVKEAMISGAFFAASKYQKTTSRENEIAGDGLVPIVTNIKIDGNKITVECDKDRGCDTIQWVADGKVIKEDNTGSCSYTIDLGDYENDLGCYIRFVLKSDAHGVTYSQPFELQYEGRAEKEAPHSILVDGFFSRIFRLWYQRLGVALLSLIGEKILAAMNVIPKVAK